jgi:hypothetical protein
MDYSNEDLSTTSIHYGPSSPTYKIDTVYSEKNHQLKGNMQVTFENNLGMEMHEIFFNLWPNAEDFQGGGIEINRVSMKDIDLDYSVDNTVLGVSNISIPEKQEITLEIAFVTTVPEQKNRFGWSDQQVSLGNWFPILAVHDTHGWNLHPYFTYGESFYSMTGNYEVSFNVPKDTDVVATGESQKVLHNKKSNLYQFKAENVRDFAAVFYSDWQSSTSMVDGTTVSVYYPDEESKQAEVIMDAATNAFRVYEKLFGSYPWDTLYIVSVDYSQDFDGGMEYPQLVMINTPYLTDEEDLSLTVMHEVAHQWFYSAVGNDQYMEPWLDESFTTFSSYVAFYDTADFDWLEEDYSAFSLTAPVSDFSDDHVEQYGDIIYDGGAKMLSDLYNLLGEDVFYDGMQTYYEKYQFGMVTTADFIRVMEDVSGKSLKPFFEAHGVLLEETK